ncbi:MAG: leucyl aminopeptidase [Firmicutes bacterium]|nr:leucyl aminopeptidase [Bacillota bacterium]
MKVEVRQGTVEETAADALVVNLFQGVEKPGGATGAVDGALGGLISRLAADGEIKGKDGEVTLIHTEGRLNVPRVLVAGLGKKEEFDWQKAAAAAAAAARKARGLGARKLATVIHGAGTGGLSPDRAAQAVVEGTILGLYEFRKFKTESDEDERPGIDELLLVEQDPAKLGAARDGAARGGLLGEVINETRDLVNSPGSEVTPTSLAECARDLALSNGLEVEILGPAELEKMGAGAILAVAKGSVQPPRLISLRYQAAGAPENLTLALVGKGITFDAGGISIKPASKMHEMKMDMAGAAAVLGAMKVVAALKPAVNVIGIVAATENLPSGTAVKPGDIAKTMSGLTVEILNTDAEGRLILADAVTYARKLGATHIVDLATLTGAVLVALGSLASGLVSNDEGLTDLVKKASELSGERVWPFPTYPEYKEDLKGEFADLKNVGGNGAGTIMGGLFIGRFAEGLPWVHLDIAGTAWNDKSGKVLGKGATGVGVRMMTELAFLMAARSAS